MASPLSNDSSGRRSVVDELTERFARAIHANDSAPTPPSVRSGVPRDLLAAALRCMVAVSTDQDVFSPDDDFEELFERGWLKTERDYCDEYTTLLTPAGAAVVREAMGWLP